MSGNDQGGSAVGAPSTGAPASPPASEDDLLSAAIDLLVFAPIGLALRAGTLLPELVQAGRQEWSKRSTVARFVGKMVVDGGRRSSAAKRTQATATPSGPTPSGPTPSGPTPSGPAVGPESAVTARPGASSAASQRAVRPKPSKPAGPSPSSGPSGRIVAPSDRRVEPASASASDLPISGYDTLAAPSIIELLGGLDTAGLRNVQRYESDHRARRTILARIAQLQGGGG